MRSSFCKNMKHLKIKLLAVSLIAASIFWLVNRAHPPTTFTDTRSDIVASLESLEGEIVEVVGGDQHVTYRWHGEMTLPYNLEEDDQGSQLSGTSRGGLTMKFPTAADHYHVIHIYDAADGRAMLVGRKVPMKRQIASIRY